jgi:predicted transcriptional regulator
MSIRYHIVLPDQQRAELGRLADKTGSSTASLVRLAIQYMLDRRELKLPADGGGEARK